MANRILVLDEKVINRIAAGEVVERPVSVVKELVENAIDAKALHIDIDIENGGKKLIRVRDDGSGMSPDDAFLALERHATSKLRSESDLVGIATMGFRGEALASIASVSKLKLMTSEGSDTAGNVIFIEGGVLRNSEQMGMSRGTVVEVRNLFFNIPVRRKFLKSPRVETDHISEMVTKLALSHPEIGFTYREDGKIKLDTPPVRSTMERVYTLYSKDVRENLMEVDYAFEQTRIHGFVARPPYARSNMRSVLTFVNGRAVRDRLINGAITKAFSSLMERGRYPLAVLFLELPPDKVDVNVHPQKAEVRFVSPQNVFDTILNGVHETLTGAPFRKPYPMREPILPTPPTNSVMKHTSERVPSLEHVQKDLTWAPSERDGQIAPLYQPSAKHIKPAEEPPIAQPQGRFSSLGIVGKIPGSFLVLHSEEELIIMDHHAAHERILFEKLKITDKSEDVSPSQDLLIPQVLEYSGVEARALASHLDMLNRTGFRIEEFGENDFVVKGVPQWLGNMELENFFAPLIEVILEAGHKGDPGYQKEEILRTMACHSAVKETEKMQPQEIKALLNDLDNVGSIEVCPHGRPIVVKMSLAEIRKKIGRK